MSSVPLTKYEEELSDPEEPIYRPPRKSHARIRNFLCYGLLILGTSIGTIYLVSLKFKSHEPDWVDCGTTAAEARANNCHYDSMQRSWIPHACWFPEPNDEYDPFRDRLWYADADFIQPADIGKLERGDDYWGFTKYFHDEHCLYAWRKLTIAVEKRKSMIDSQSADIGHSTHCAKRIAGRLVQAENVSWSPIDGEYTESPLMFQTCVPLRWAEP